MSDVNRLDPVAKPQVTFGTKGRLSHTTRESISTRFLV
jgi:hypothetical protein